MALTHPLPTEVGAEALPHTIPYYLADRIKAGIIRWRYPPKSSLRESELAAEFGASRGPVREALRILELQDLVIHAPRRGFKVKAFTSVDLRQLYRLRAQGGDAGTAEGVVADLRCDTGRLGAPQEPMSATQRKPTGRQKQTGASVRRGTAALHH